jgi:hypothetical protein
MAVADAGDGIGVELAQLVDTHAGAGQQLDRHPTSKARLGRHSTHEPGEVGVVEEPRQGLGPARYITDKDRDFGWRIGPVPLGDADKEHTQHPKPTPDGRLLKGCPAPANIFPT